MKFGVAGLLFAATFLVGCTSLNLTPSPLLAHAGPATQQCGGASWYAMPGSRTANGESMDPGAMTAAHRTLPFGTIVKVTNERTGKSVNVRINDRGPFVGGRIIDLSRAAAVNLGFLGAGHTEVCIESRA